MCWVEEDNNFVLAVTGGEMDDRERLAIEDEMDRLRMCMGG